MTTRELRLLAGTSNVMTRPTMHFQQHDNNAFSVEIMSTSKPIKGPFERSYDKQNITLMVISYVISSIYAIMLIENLSELITTTVKLEPKHEEMF